MSTDLYLTCESHDPPLKSFGEVGHNLSHLEQIRADIRDRAALIKLQEAAGGWFEMDTPYRTAALWFLAKHPDCEIGIIDEYGQTYSVSEEKEEPNGVQTVMGTVTSMVVTDNGVEMRVKFGSLTGEGKRVARMMGLDPAIWGTREASDG